MMDRSAPSKILAPGCPRAALHCALAALGLAGCAHPRGKAPAPPPEILGFEASASRVEPGDRVRLRPVYRHGAGIIEPGPGPAASGGEVLVRVDTPTTFTLSVTGPDGRAATRQVAVEVEPALILEVRGLREARARIAVAGPWGYRETVEAPCVLRGLQPGTYTLDAAEVEDGGIRKRAWEPLQAVVVDTGVKAAFLYPEPAFKVDLQGCAPLEFLLMPAGTFRMGTEEAGPPDLPGPLPRPVHDVTFRTAFYMTKHLVTREQWWAVAQGGHAGKPGNPAFPVDGVSHRDITETFLPALGLRCPGQAFALPSEAMWEYGCRAGTTTRYFFGPDERGMDDYFWRRAASPVPGHPVGAKLPNPWGLHDLSGLGYQWCADAAHPDYSGAPSDGSARMEPLAGRDFRIARGGDDAGCGGPSAARQQFRSGLRASRLGFRIVATRPWFGPGAE